MIKSVAAQIEEWFSSKNFTSVKLTQLNPRTSDPLDDYVVVHKSHFQPSDLERARVEVWVTDDNYIGVGFEERERIATRLNTRDLMSHGFAAGFEPCEKNSSSLISFLEMVSAGKVCVFARRWPIFGLGRTWAAIVSDSQSSELGRFGPTNWLKHVKAPAAQKGVILFKPWF